jgi:hypothetical protein
MFIYCIYNIIKIYYKKRQVKNMLKITHPYTDTQKNLFSIDANEPIAIEAVKVDKKSDVTILFVYRLKDMELNTASRDPIGIIRTVDTEHPIIFKVKNLFVDENRRIVEMSEKNITIKEVQLKSSSIFYIDCIKN